ncbi:ribonuclease M5 [Salipaludibacillus keqinensis]|uniref:Ribonuclease M5 n=1 Tax=Salipaludibacillus keqinensis TaxID=2045207 RepID=A0A323T868_9BACI|nr:ribonuclease M5 [Salipaludibacillus keqinensis]PYZ91540.1 ribonuclease M5 [Salipaludibacillus keqinensis]
MERYKITEMIVVEGKNDTNALKRSFACDTIETNGSAISDSTLNKIRLALDRRGVIVFTDPDYPGEKIRKKIDQRVPGCKHAFLRREAAIDHRKKKIGIEHANSEELFASLLAAQSSFSEEEEGKEEIMKEDLLKAGFIAGDLARNRRARLGDELNIGYTNGKQLYKRLKQFRVTKEEFQRAAAKVEKELRQI